MKNTPKKKMNKKGSVLDLPLIVVILFVLGIAVVIGMYMLNTFASSVGADTSVPVRGRNIINSINSQANWVVDFMYIMIMIGLPVASSILAFYNDIHPIFFSAGIGMTLMVVLLAGKFGDAWVAMGETTLGATMVNIPMTNFVLSNFAVYALFCSLVVAAGTFVKARRIGFI